MASYQAVAAVGRAVVALLEDATRPEEFADSEFILFKTEDFEQPLETGLSVYLYRIEIDRHTPAALVMGPGGHRIAPPLSLVLHYLLTPWSVDAASEHMLLAWGMRVLDDSPVISGTQLNGVSAGTFADTDEVLLLLRDTPLGEMTDLWRALGSNYRIGASYVAQTIVLDAPISADR